jgi:hypothetical protein
LATRRSLRVVSTGLISSLEQNLETADLAERWTLTTPRIPKYSKSHKYMLIEFSFLKEFLAWEEFLEQSFILMLLGKRSKIPAPKIIIKPATRAIALSLVNGDKSYVDWTDVDKVVKRAQRFFKDGKPFDALKLKKRIFSDIKIVRNCIAHRSESSWESFETVARRELLGLPFGMSPGKFLDTIVPPHTETYKILRTVIKYPSTYLETYSELFRLTANLIVRL